jgi:gamma-glutamyltranspeptidase/glutathione hydrolase
MTHSLVVSSGVVTQGLGFPYNNSMKLAGVSRHGPNALAPRKARNVGICPTIAFKDGEFQFALGAPGGSVIISSVVQSLVNFTQFGMTPVEAVSAPRIHCEGGTVFCESRVLSPTLDALRGMGHEVKQHPCSYPAVFSRAQLLVRDADGGVRGASDPRNDGGIPVVAYGDGTIGMAVA